MRVIVVKVKDSINLAALTHIPYLLPSAFSLPNILAVFFTSFTFAIFYNIHRFTDYIDTLYYDLKPVELENLFKF